MIKSLSVVIPSYSEEERLSLTLKENIDYLETRGIDYEIIVVSDGSRDATEKIAVEFSRQNPRLKLLVNRANMGKGYSVRRGVLSSEKELVLFMDADNSTKIPELEQFEQYLGAFDVLIGSRALPRSKIIKHQLFLREFLGKAINFFVRLFILRGIKDTQCGFKLFKRKAAIDIFNRSKINRFVFDVEILSIAKKLGYKIIELPVTWINSKPSKVSFFGDAVNIICDLISVIIRVWTSSI